MEYAVISDIHGCAGALEKALEMADSAGCGTLLLLGDLLYHGPRNKLRDGYDPARTADLLNSRKDQIIAVRGNCDAEVDQMMLDFPVTSPSNIFLCMGRRVFMTHGHLYRPEDAPLGKGGIFMSGHTHLACLEKSGDRILFNPGSVSMPKGGLEPSMGILSEERRSLALVPLNAIRVDFSSCTAISL